MKSTKWVGLVAALALPLLAAHAQTPGAPVPGTPAQAQAAAPANLSPSAAEVVRLAGSGVGDDVVVAYIQNTQTPFTLSADDVLYLKDIGLSPQVTSAMLSHDSALRNQPQQYAPAAPAPAAPPGTAPSTYQWQSPAAPTAPVPTEPPPPATAPPPTYVTSAPADVSYFYNDLSPYGTWVSLEGYGWCWQPRAVVISRGWRPYCDGGHWVYSDVGWYWQSDYSWGWAPFHYGRWYSHPSCGWVWTPDRVWGPAWVTWRVAGDSCGWAPLPPRATFDVRLGWRFNGVSVGANFDFGLGINAFAFVAFGDFGSHDLGRRRLPPERVTTIYRQTTIINNYEVHNNTVVHRGIPIERVSAASRTPVPRATVREWRAAPERMPAQSGEVVYRPELKAPARPVNMAAQKLDDRHPVIQHAPIAPVRTERPSTFSRSGSAPVATPRRPAVEPPKVSPWSSGAKPASPSQHQPTPRTSQPAPTPATPKASPWSSSAQPRASSQYQPTPRTSQPAATAETPKTSPRSSGAEPISSPRSQPTPTALPVVTAPRAPEDWKQGNRPAPGYRSDAGLPALNNARIAGESSAAPTQTPSQGRNAPAYLPKGHPQAAEMRSVPQSSQRPSARSSSPANNADARSGKSQR